MYLSYTYLVKNKITNQFYYGSRCKNVRLKITPEEDMWVNYFTSSKIVKELIEEYGNNSFDIKIILKDIDYDKCYFLEQELISEHINDPLCLNKYCRKTGKFSMAGTSHSAETKSRMSKAAGGKIKGPRSEETKLKISNSTRGKNNSFYGKHHSVETKSKMSELKLGISTGPMPAETKHKISKSKKGKICSEDTRMLISRSMTGKRRSIESILSMNVTCPHCSKSGYKSTMMRWHFDKCNNMK